MAIKPPVKTIEEAFSRSCKKNGISVRKRKINRTSMPIVDEKGDVFMLSEDLSIKKKPTITPSKKKGFTKLKPSVEKPEMFSPIVSAGKAGRKGNSRTDTRTKELIKA